LANVYNSGTKLVEMKV